MAGAPVNPGWRRRVRLADLRGGAVEASLAADAPARAELARTLGLEELKSLTARLTVSPWLDGAEICGRLHAEVSYTCSVTLEPFDASVDDEIRVRVVPQGSVNAPGPVVDEIIDLDADDPPEVLNTDVVDLAGLVEEHLALALDPYPRAPGAEFAPLEAEAVDSPFAALKALQTRGKTP